jgi:hypothetical protein
MTFKREFVTKLRLRYQKSSRKDKSLLLNARDLRFDLGIKGQGSKFGNKYIRPVRAIYTNNTNEPYEPEDPESPEELEDPPPEPDPDPVEYQLGSTGPAGGIIFFIDDPNNKLLSPGINYLEASLSDNGVKPWGGYGVEDIDASGQNIGSGLSNTDKIVNKLGEADSAAKLGTGSFHQKMNLQN